MNPPERFETESEKEAWTDGFMTASKMIQARVAELATQVDTDDPDEGDDTCPDCGAELIRVLGGEVCPECDDNE